MKHKSIVWMLSLLGLAGCKNANVENGDSANNSNDIVKTDTALVLGVVHGGNQVIKQTYYLMVTKGGNTIKTNYSTYDIGDDNLNRFSNVGDTVVVARNKENSYITKNLTLENKIKAFSKQR